MVVALFALVLLAWIWIGYPIAIAALAAVRRNPTTHWPGELPDVSVVIATRERGDAIERRVADILASDYPAPRLEVVVCIDANADDGGTPTLPDAGARVRTLRGPASGGKAVTVSAGVEAARGEIIVLADTAQRFAPDAITQLVHAMGDPRMGAVSGRLVMDGPRREQTLIGAYWALERRLRRAEARLHSAVGVTGAIYAMRRRLFTPLPDGLILDDLYVPMQLILRGLRVGYCDGAQALEPRRFAIRDEQRRKVRTLTGVIQLCVLLPDVLKPWRNPIWAQFVCHKLLRFASPVLISVAVLGALSAVWRALGSSGADHTALIVAFAFLGAGLAVVAVPRARGLVAEFVHLHTAIVQAAANGVRGRWDVW